MATKKKAKTIETDKTSINTVYPLKEKTQTTILLTLLIGEQGQAGSSSIVVTDSSGNTVYAKNKKGDVVRLPVVVDTGLASCVLIISTRITDVSKEHNNTKLTVLLEGGLESQNYILKEVLTDGGTSSYLCVFNFL